MGDDTFQMPQSFVFIVTYGRSGSTLLQNLLNSLPGYLIRGENDNTVLYLAQAWRAVNKSVQINSRRSRGTVTDQTSPWFGAELIEAEAYGKALAESFTRHVLQVGEGVRVAGFKEIRFANKPKPFWTYLNFLYTCFPNAKFIFNTRDHAAVARSGWWQSRDAEDVAAQLRAAEELYTAYQRKFPRRGYALHYDEYVADPSLLKGLFAFLEEPYDPDLVRSVMDRKLDHLQDMKIPK